MTAAGWQSIMVYGALAAVLVLVIGSIGWGMYEASAKDAAAQHIAGCARMHGDPKASVEFYRYEIDNPAGGVTWRQAADMLLAAAGCGPSD